MTSDASETNHCGSWQAQGCDIPHRGHAAPWDQLQRVTKEEGLGFLEQLKELCTAGQRTLRDQVHRHAVRYVMRAPPDGIQGFLMKSFYVKSPPASARKARIDLEVIVGWAFCDNPDGA